MSQLDHGVWHLILFLHSQAIFASVDLNGPSHSAADIHEGQACASLGKLGLWLAGGFSRVGLRVAEPNHSDRGKTHSRVKEQPAAAAKEAQHH